MFHDSFTFPKKNKFGIRCLAPLIPVNWEKGNRKQDILEYP